MTQVLGVIPSRFASQRFPGKPLALIMGKTMIEWVYKRARVALSRVVVATDDMRIVQAVHVFGGEAFMTPRSCSSGTDRMAWMAKKIKARYYVNIQGDEPLIHPQTIKETINLSRKRRSVATAATKLEKKDQNNPNVVKVVMDNNQRALYFSRAMIPFSREAETTRSRVISGVGLKHLGLYVYPRQCLLQFVSWAQPSLEQIEKLEQLRALFYGMPIYVATTPYDSIGVDSPGDLKVVTERLTSNS